MCNFNLSKKHNYASINCSRYSRPDRYLVKRLDPIAAKIEGGESSTTPADTSANPFVDPFGDTTKTADSANAFADIDVQLRQRHDLIPQLVDTVKGYATHEKDLLLKITEARTAAMNATKISWLPAAGSLMQPPQSITMRWNLSRAT